MLEGGMRVDQVGPKYNDLRSTLGLLEGAKLEQPNEQLVEDCRGLLQALRNKSLEG